MLPPDVLDAFLSFLSLLSPSSSSLGSGASPLLPVFPVSPGLLLMTPLLAGMDLALGLLLLVEDLLEALPEFDPSFLLESA